MKEGDLVRMIQPYFGGKIGDLGIITETRMVDNIAIYYEIFFIKTNKRSLKCHGMFELVEEN